MADEQYDADGDVSRFLYEPTMEDPMAAVLGPSLTVAAEPQAVSHSHQAHQIQAPPSSSSHFQSPPVPAIHVQPLQGQAIHSQTHQASPAMHVQHHRVPAPAIQAQPRHVHQPPSSPMHLQPHPAPAIQDQPHLMPASDVQLQPHHVPAVQSLYQAPPSLHVQPNPASTGTEIQPRQVPSMHFQVHPPPPTMDVQPQPAPAIAPPASVQNQETMALSPAAYAHDHMMMMTGALDSEGLYPGVPVTTSPSLYDQFMAEGEYDLAARLRSIEDDDDEDGTGEGGPDVDPVEDGVVFRAGQPRCENCHVVREVKHESESRALYFIVHSTSPGTFEHAIISKYITAGGQIPRVEMHYVDLRKRTHEWVRNFISKSVETLRNDTSGQLHDSCSSYCEAVSTNITTAVVNDPYMELEVGMLKEILSSTHNTTAKNIAPPAIQSSMQDDDDTLEEIGAYDDDNCSELLPQILESSHVPMPGVGGQGSSVSATAYPSMLARQTLRVSKMSMQDTLEYLHKTKEDAEKEMSDYATFKQQCRKNQQYRWAAQQINKLNKKIMKLEQTGQRVGETGLLKIKQKLDVIVAEKRRLYADVRKGLQKERENKGDGSSSSNNDRGGCSGHNNKDGAAASDIN